MFNDGKNTWFQFPIPRPPMHISGPLVSVFQSSLAAQLSFPTACLTSKLKSWTLEIGHGSCRRETPSKAGGDHAWCGCRLASDWQIIGKYRIPYRSSNTFLGSKKLIVGLYLRRSCSNCSSTKDRIQLHGLAHYENNLIWFSGSARSSPAPIPWPRLTFKKCVTIEASQKGDLIGHINSLFITIYY